jgi:hypothetical protein
MKIGISFSGIGGNNGADYVADYLSHAALISGHDVTLIGGMGSQQEQNIPDGLDVVIHSSGFGLTPELVESWKKKTKVFVWTANDEVPLFQEKIGRITNLVDKHFSYTRMPIFANHLIEYLPLAADHSVYYPIDCKKKYDIAMIGAAHRWRREFAMKISSHFPNCFFDFSMNKSYYDVNLLYNMTRIIIAPMQDCDQYNQEAVFGCPCRTFDVPASGAFQLQAYRAGLRDVHEESLLTKITMPSIRDVDTSLPIWIHMINDYLSNKQLADELATQARNDIITKHLYIHRLEKMLSFL